MKHRGVKLGCGRFSEDGPLYYKVKVGRELGYSPPALLSTEWRDVYIRWHRERGEIERAKNLRWGAA